MKQNIVPSLVERVAAIDKRLQNLERLRTAPNLAMRDLTDTQIASLSNNQSLVWDTRKQTWVPADPTDMVFSYPGSVLSATSPPYVPKDNINVTGLAAAVGSAGSTDSTITLQRNGSAVITLTLATGQTYANTALPADTPGNYNGRLDVMTLHIVPGTGLADFVGTVELG